MSKKVLILMGSPRKKGNTALLCEEFARGALETGNKVEQILIREHNINGCVACGACRKNGGICIQQDEMQRIYELIEEADAIVLGSPIYYYTWSSQMKTVLDRFYAKSPSLQNKTFYLISACHAGEEKYTETMLDTFRKFHGCFRAGGNKEGGYVFGLGTGEPGDIIGNPAMEKAYEMGKNVDAVN